MIRHAALINDAQSCAVLRALNRDAMQCPRDGVAHSLGGLVYFEEYAELNGVQMFMFVCGSLITIGGIGYLLRYRRCGVECVCVFCFAGGALVRHAVAAWFHQNRELCDDVAIG